MSRKGVGADAVGTGEAVGGRMGRGCGGRGVVGGVRGVGEGEV